MRDLVFLIDLDNTILDNDSVKKDIEARMLAILGPELAARFWELYELVRKDLDVIDFWEQMKRLKAEHPDNRAVDEAADALAEWDFRSRVYPRAIETVLHLKKMGMPVVVSDGDAVFQPTKIHGCGVTEAVDGRVLIFAHKEKHLPFVEQQFQAEHYVLIDDKPGILMRSKAVLGDRLTTVHVLQGKYALDPKHAADYKPDIVAKNFSDLLEYTKADFAKPRAAAAVSGG
ncbi:MAG TPA: HAD family hydrolase [Dehalococcoidia bacterium]|nr:HAD family hydrolase [Dehalococcoidia bacterium]